MDKCAIYARVSSERQEKDETIKSQIAKLREYAEGHSYEIPKEQEYIDDGYSGDLLVRPALERLRNDAEAGRLDRVLILSPDRLARKYIYIEILSDELRKRGVAIEFLNQKNDGSDEGRLLSGVTGLFAEYEKAKFLERCRRGRLHRAELGLMVTSRAPYGYDYIPKSEGVRERLRIKDDQAKNVRVIFSLCVDKALSVSGIIRELSQRGILPPQRFQPTHFWAKSTLKKILKNETYCGTWHYGKYYSAEPLQLKSGKVYRSLRTSRRLTPRDTWIPISAPAIISRETYQLAQEQIKKNWCFSPRNTKKNFYLLGGLCRCGDCGYTYQGIPSHGRTFYRCNGPRINRLIPRTCFNPCRPTHTIETAVWESISKALQNPRLLNEHLDGTKTRLKHGADYADNERQRIVKDKARLDQAENRLLDAFSGGLITPEQLKAQMGKIKYERQGLTSRESELRTADTARPRYEDAERLCRSLSRGLEKVDGDPLKKRELLKMLVKTITIKRTELVISGALPAREPSAMQGDVAATITGRYGRYTAIPFELVTQIQRSPRQERLWK